MNNQKKILLCYSCEVYCYLKNYEERIYFLEEV